MLKIDKEKFMDYIVHFLTGESIYFLEKIGKTEDVKKMKSIKLTGAWKSFITTFTQSAILDLLDFRTLHDPRALLGPRDLLDFRALYGKKLMNAYIYAGGRKANLKVRNINAKQLEAITGEEWLFDMSAFEKKSGCETSYCMAGGAVILAGQEDLKDWIGWANTASMIYYASTGIVPDFYSDNKTALKYMKENQ